jgi:DNA-binding FrmR family transcriptional regulator
MKEDIMAAKARTTGNPTTPHAEEGTVAADNTVASNMTASDAPNSNAATGNAAAACGGCCARSTHRDEREKKALITRLNRVEGQIRGVRGMIEKDAYCDDVLNQIQAARAAMDAVSRLVLERHMKRCLVDRVRAGEDEVIDELLVTRAKRMR